FALPREVFRRTLLLRDVARERQNSLLAADRDTPDEHIVPAQAAVLAPAVPFEANLLSGAGARDQSHRVLLGIRTLPGAERADVERSKLLARVAKSGAGLRIDIDDRARIDVVDENRVLRGVEDRPIACLRN